MNHNGQQVAFGVYRDVALAAFDLLARVITAPPPFRTVFAVCESTIATVGVVFRPFAERPCSRSVLPSHRHPLHPEPPTATATEAANLKEAIAANVKALIEQLEEGHSEGLTAYLTAMGRFHNYSFGNILEIARQKPSATRVAGMYAWNKVGRRVNKGEKGSLARLYRHGVASPAKTGDSGK